MAARPAEGGEPAATATPPLPPARRLVAAAGAAVVAATIVNPLDVIKVGFARNRTVIRGIRRG